MKVKKINSKQMNDNYNRSVIRDVNKIRRSVTLPTITVNKNEYVTKINDYIFKNYPQISSKSVALKMILSSPEVSRYYVDKWNRASQSVFEADLRFILKRRIGNDITLEQSILSEREEVYSSYFASSVDIDIANAYFKNSDDYIKYALFNELPDERFNNGK